MEVIKPGAQTAPTWEATCKGETDEPGCGALLRVTKDDLFVSIWGSGMDDFNDEQRVTFLCPQCGCTTSNAVKVKAAVRHSLPQPRYDAIDRARERVRTESTYTPPKSWK